MSNESEDAKKNPGRPRDAEAEGRLLATALERLIQDGYSRMSLDDIAERAGVSKPTIYRRWKGKADLATAALRTLQISEPVPAARSPREELVAVLTNFRRSLLRPNGMALIGTVLAEEAHTPELMELFRERIVGPRRRMIRATLERAAEAGELRRGVDPDTAAAMLIGAFYAAYLARPRIPADFPETIVDLLWRGIAKHKIEVL